MDEKLDKSMKEMICLMEIHNELTFKCFANIPGYLTVDGNDIGPFSKTEDFSSFLHDNLQRIRIDYSTFFSKKAFSGKEAFLNSLDDYSKDLIRLYNHNLFIVCSLIDSLEELIPQKIDKENVECMEVVNTIRIIRKHYNDIDLRYLFKSLVKQLFKQIKRINEKKVVKEKDTICLRMNCISTISSFLQYDEIKTLVIYLRLRIYEYFYGLTDKRGELANEIKQLSIRIGVLSSQTSSLNEGVNQILQGQGEIKQTIDSQGEQFNIKFGTIENKLDEKDRAGKTKPLKLTTCLDAIQEEYDNPKYNYHQQFKLHPFAIRNTLSQWNQHLETGGKKGKPPLPKFDSYRHTDKEIFKQWVRVVFFPDYRNRAHKDALDNASRLDPENTPGSDGEEIIDAVDASFANDSNNNAKNDSNSNTKK